MMFLLRILGWGSIGLGVFFAMAMTVAIIRFPDAYTRMHAGTKGLTIGAGLILMGSALLAPDLSHAVRTILVGLFLMATNPLATHAVARANYRTGRERHRLVVDDYQDFLEKDKNA
ncbi:MAG: monovalent cation/H(+) antiporter subunit G [Kiritimatiellia bacterium]|nr:monovalent cation/H(+) antiporter subunit G [Lentisphaerota bacterium]